MAIYRSKKWLAAVGQIERCVLCGAWGTQVAHRNEGKGMGLKADDCATAALCVCCHGSIDTGADIRRGHRYTDKECDALLQSDLRKVASAIDPLIKVHVPETTRAALYSFIYNVGAGAFSRSTLLKKLNSGDVLGACKELQRWMYAGGKQWKGLITRREIEREVCEWSQK